MKPAVSIEHLKKSYGDVAAVKDVTFNWSIVNFWELNKIHLARFLTLMGFTLTTNSFQKALCFWI